MDERWAKKTVTDMRIVCEPSYRLYNPHRYGSPEYWTYQEKELNSEAREFEAFIRDHRSRDGVSMFVEKTRVITCKFCGYAYEDYNEDANIKPDCCDEAMEAAGLVQEGD